MTIRSSTPLRAACILAVCGLGGAVLAADLDPTSQGGQYAAVRPTTLVKGTGWTLTDSTVYVPFILDHTDGFLNATVVQTVGGKAVGYTTTFNADALNTTANRTVTILGTTDAADGGVSNNVIVSETAIKGNSPGSILPDGTITFMERFSFNGQNNLGAEFGITGVSPQTAAPPIRASNRIFSDLAVGIGNATETANNPQTGTVLGNVFIGTPSSVRDPSRSPIGNADLLTGNTHFNLLPALAPGIQFAASVISCSVYAGLNNDPKSGCSGNTTGCAGLDHVGAWTRDFLPLPTIPAGATIAASRQSQPVLTLVTTPSGQRVVYVMHGIGFTGGLPFTGSSAKLLFLAVDTLRLEYAHDQAIAENNTILIEADAAGAVGTQHGAPFGTGAGFADFATTDGNMRFVDHVSTGRASQVSSVSQYDMNSQGYVAAILENRNVTPTLYQVRLYSPLWNAANNRIVGFNLAKIVTFNGDLDNAGAVLIPPETRNTTVSLGLATESTVNPFSGLSLDDNNRLTFTALSEIFTVTGHFDANPFGPLTIALVGSTSTLYLYDLTTDTLHALLKGGQSGDTISDAFPATGSASNEDLMLGQFAVNASSDSHSRESLSRDGKFIGLSFRSSNDVFVGGVRTEFDTLPDQTNVLNPPVPEGFLDRGGLLFAPGQLGMNEQSVRGSLIIKVGLLQANAPPPCPGDGNGDGVVNFADITAVVANWLTAGPAGDANHDGTVNFADITAVVANWLVPCP